MKKKDNAQDPLPDSFQDEVEAGAFWDTHSTMDYQEHLEPANDTIQIHDRVYEIQVSPDIYALLTRQAQQMRESVPQVVDRMLRKSLAH